MATFLELCQQVAEESGTVSGMSSPPTVVGQSGRLQRIVNWTSRAYTSIQTKRPDWLWLRGEFEGTTIPGVQRYTGAGIGISDRFSRWLVSDEGPVFSVHLPSEPRSTEGWLIPKPWEDFRTVFARGTPEVRKPLYVSIDPQGHLVFYPTPDDAYTIRGPYVRSPQILRFDDDVPEMPVEHHEAIVWEALLRLGTFDEAGGQMNLWGGWLADKMASLVNEQTPRIRFSGPLA